MWKQVQFSTFVMWRNLSFLHNMMWSNFRFLHTADVEKSEISPHERFFSTGITCGPCDKYEEWDWDAKAENMYDNLKCLFGEEVKWISPFLSLVAALAFLRRGHQLLFPL